jgi:hypothetical protein
MGSDTSDTISDRPGEPTTDSDAEDTGEHASVGLGGGLDQAEEAQLGTTDEEMRDSELRKLKKRKP